MSCKISCGVCYNTWWMYQEEENTHQSYVWLWAFLRSCMHVYMHVRTYVPTYMHTYVRTYKCMHICTYVYMYFCEYLCWGELYTCDKVINGWLFMLFNAYIIKNVSCRWLRSQIIILWLKGRNRWHCICYKDICVKRYNQHPLWSAVGDFLSW